MRKTKRNSSKLAASLEDLPSLELHLAKRVLLLLVERHPELHSEVSELASWAKTNPDEFLLAAEIGETIKALDEGDVLKRCGRRRGSYTEPEEAAAEALSEAMEPYFDRLELLLKDGNDVAALSVCKAIVLAMYKFSQEEDHPLLENYEEYPEETADWAVRLWRSGGEVATASSCNFDSDREFPAAFAKSHTPDWDWLIDE